MDGEAADRYFETLYASSQVKEDVAATILTIQQLAGMGRCRRQFRLLGKLGLFFLIYLIFILMAYVSLKRGVTEEQG